MKKHLLSVFTLCCALCMSSSAWANTGDDGLATKEANEVAQDNTKDIVDKVLAAMPKISGYVQTGYTWTDKNAGNSSSFQMKRMRLFIDKKISNVFDFRAQFEVFSGSTDGNGVVGGRATKKVMTVMDAFVNAHISKALHFRAGQYYLPLGFENYDISPASLETIDFSNINYRMVCRNAASSSANFVDYGRDIGIMAYGDLFENQDKGFNYLSYELSLTNGHLPTLADNNKSKDFVGRLTIRPIKNLRIIGSYNYGEYQGLSPLMEGDKPVVDADGNAVKESKPYLPMNRFIVGAWYNDPNGLSLRSEYGYIKSSKANVKEQGVYVLAAYRFDKFQPVVRWDMYRDKINKETSLENRDNLLVGINYDIIKDVTVQFAYNHIMYTSKVKDNTGLDNGNGIAIMCRAKF